MSTQTKTTFCHHCGKQIVWNQTYPDKRNSHWAHAILEYWGKTHTLENALMEGRCADNRHWATPKRSRAKKCEICGAKMKGPETICTDCHNAANPIKGEYCDMCGCVTDHVLTMCPGVNGKQL